MSNYFTDEAAIELCQKVGLTTSGVIVTSDWTDGVIFEELKALMDIAVDTAILNMNDDLMIIASAASAPDGLTTSEAVAWADGYNKAYTYLQSITTRGEK